MRVTQPALPLSGVDNDLGSDTLVNHKPTGRVPFREVEDR
jgi:hypothetical protein